MKILFWGTSDFAVPSLAAIHAEGHQLLGVVTQPDRPAGRGHALRASPVKRWAVEHDLVMHQPDRASAPDFMERINAMGIEFNVVVAYGQILKQAVLSAARIASVNVHGSLLPRHRGAAPVARAILAGDRESGVTIMQMDVGMDTGPVYLRVATPVGEVESATSLAGRLAAIGATTIVSALPGIADGSLAAVPQNNEIATIAAKIGRNDARVQWSDAAIRVCRRIRAMDSVPGAFAMLGDAPLKLFTASLGSERSEGAPGAIVAVDENGLRVAAGDGGEIIIGEVQPSGGRRMSALSWSRGLHHPPERLA